MYDALIIILKQVSFKSATRLDGLNKTIISFSLFAKFVLLCHLNSSIFLAVC